MREKLGRRQSSYPNMSDANKLNHIVFAGAVKRSYRHTLGLKMDTVRGVRLLKLRIRYVNR